MKPKLLDLFCCAGGCSMGYHLAGFEVVGVDINPQPHYPLEFHQADAMTFPLEGFDAYHASPPCQGYSVAFSPLVGKRKEHPKLINQVRDMLSATGKPFVIENVPGSELVDYIKLSGTMFGLSTIKERWFEVHGFELPILIPPPIPNTKGMVKTGKLVGLMAHSDYPLERCKREDMAVAYGIDWGLNRHELRQAIPPAYTEYIGKHLLNSLEWR